MPRVIETNITEEDIRIEGTLRPQTLDDYIGQEKAKENLKVYIEAARQRGDALVPLEQLQDAVRALHTAYGLDAEQVEAVVYGGTGR